MRTTLSENAGRGTLGHDIAESNRREAKRLHMEQAAKTKQPEPVVTAIRQARREHAKTPAGQLEALFREESRWRRKETIARTKLVEVRERIQDFARGLVEVEAPKS